MNQFYHIINPNQMDFRTRDPLVRELEKQGTSICSLVINNGEEPKNIADRIELIPNQLPLIITYLSLLEDDIPKAFLNEYASVRETLEVTKCLLPDHVSDSLYSFRLLKELTEKFDDHVTAMSLSNLPISHRARSLIFANFRWYHGSLAYSWKAESDYYKRNAKYLLMKSMQTLR